MTIVPSTASLLARQVRLIICPPANTLFESRAILSEVQSKFGSISTFISQRNDLVLDRLLKSGPNPTRPSSQSPSQIILAIFDSPVSKKSALDSDPLTISCGGGLVPSPKDLDPYNARGFRGRHHPPKRTFTCQILEDEDPSIHQRLRDHNPYSGPFRINTLQMSYRDLIKAGTPLKEMADVMETELTPIDAREQIGHQQGDVEGPEKPSRRFYTNRDRLRDPQHEGGLMAAWRRGLKGQEAEKEEVEREEAEKEPQQQKDPSTEQYE
jgi:hypothetical protein